jgi:hypothetical protein
MRSSGLIFLALFALTLAGCGHGPKAIRANPARVDRRAIRGPPDQPDPSGNQRLLRTGAQSADVPGRAASVVRH